MRKVWFYLVMSLIFIATSLAASTQVATAATEPSLTLTVPVQQNVKGQLSYKLTATSHNEAPLPPEMSEGTMTLRNTAAQNLSFTFVRPGVYSYHLALVGAERDIVRASQQFYDFDVWFFYNDDGLLTSQLIAKNAEGYKADSLLFRAVPPVPVTGSKSPPPTSTANGTRPHAGTPLTGKLPQTGDLVRSFSWLGLLFILIALLKLLLDRRRNKNS